MKVSVVCVLSSIQTEKWCIITTLLANGHDTLQSLHYAYDGVGNILRIDQTAPHLAAHFGGPYSNEYFYDQQYRLTVSKGFIDYPYYLGADYSGAGRLGHRFCSGLLEGTVDALYGYHVSHDTHQPRTIFDNKLGKPISLFWDANGNLAQVVDCARESFRLHDWDDENRLRLLLDSKTAAYYGYDGNGERVYKLTGRCNVLSHIGNEITADAVLDDAVLYPNPYIVITPKGYTKHYYAGTERLATVIGQGGFNLMDTCIRPLSLPEENWCANIFKRYDKSYPLEYKYFDASQHNETIEGKQEDGVQYKCNPMVLNKLTLHYDHALLLNHLDWASGTHGKETDIYFYHGDHLGSANWITDAVGQPVQYIHYAPYGELIADTRLTNYRERFTFTGKERDKESGYDYFGARYWWAPGGHWLSVDPLADENPGKSPYAYCSWDPVNKYDPDGREEWELDANTGKFQNIGNKGGSKVDYYSVGTREGDKFSSYSNYTIERGEGAINSFRIQETENSTISALHIPETNTAGFFLERPGPDTEESGQSLRILAGQYGLHENSGSNYPGVPRLYSPSEGINGKFDGRGILIHVGNYPENSVGCLLPGNSKSTDFVGGSKQTLQKIINYVVSTGWGCKLNIYNSFR